MPKCVNCKHCIETMDIDCKIYYLCKIGENIETVEEYAANDDNLPCDLYEHDSDDDFTA